MNNGQISNEMYFFDTYAFFEIIRGNNGYERFRDVIAITTIFNLAELNYGLKKEHDEKTANEFTDKYAPFLVDVTIDDVKKAMSFKKEHKKLSIPDAIGYIIAKKMNVKFLTGDLDFKDFESVELVR